MGWCQCMWLWRCEGVRPGAARVTVGGTGGERASTAGGVAVRQAEGGGLLFGARAGGRAKARPTQPKAGRAASVALLLHSRQAPSGQRLSTNQAQSARPQRPRRRRGFLYFIYFLYFASIYFMFFPLTVWGVGVDELLLEGAHRHVGALWDVENLRAQPALRGRGGRGVGWQLTGGA